MVDSESLSYTLARWAWITGVFIVGSIVWKKQGIRLVLAARSNESDDEEEAEEEEVEEEVEGEEDEEGGRATE
jgi:hypothetical protein